MVIDYAFLAELCIAILAGAGLAYLVTRLKRDREPRTLRRPHWDAENPPYPALRVPHLPAHDPDDALIDDGPTLVSATDPFVDELEREIKRTTKAAS